MKKLLPRIIGFYLNALALISPKQSGKIGFRLFSSPRRAPVKDFHLSFYSKGEQSSFQLEGYTLQTFKWGTGPTKILFLHGWQSHSFRWKKYIDSFPKDQYSLYAIDAPAHGLSSGETISLPLYSRAIERFIGDIGHVHGIVAHSFGGLTMLHTIYLNPAIQPDRLVLMGVPGESRDFIMQLKDFMGVNARTIGGMEARFKEVVNQSPDFYSSKRFAERVTVPTLIIHNDPDPEADYRYAVLLSKIIPGSKLVTTQGLGHNLKSPEVVAQVREFVA